MIFANNYYFDRLRKEMDEFFSGLAHHSEFPPVNIYSNENDLVIMAEVPGVNAKNLDVNYEDNVLTLKGEIAPPVLPGKETFIKKERSFGKFSRAFSLPQNVASDKIDAQYKDGILILTVPIAKNSAAKKIIVNSN